MKLPQHYINENFPGIILQDCWEFEDGTHMYIVFQDHKQVTGMRVHPSCMHKSWKVRELINV